MLSPGHLFVRLFYSAYFEEVKNLFILANAGQVLFFVCNTLMVIVLRYTAERNQLIVNICYIIVFFAVTVPLVLNHGVFGMAWGILIANAFKFAVYTAVGFFGLRPEKGDGK